MRERLAPQRTSPRELAGRIKFYFARTNFMLGRLDEDAATISHSNRMSETVESDMDNVLGFSGDRVTMEDRCASAYALGVVIGAALKESGLELPEPYQELVADLSKRSVDG